MLLETNYRERLHMVTNEVKRRLDYQIALQDLHRRMEQEHMVSWVEKSVVSSLTPQQVSGFESDGQEPARVMFLSHHVNLCENSALSWQKFSILYFRLKFNKL